MPKLNDTMPPGGWLATGSSKPPFIPPPRRNRRTAGGGLYTPSEYTTWLGWAPLPKPSQHSLWFQAGAALAAVRVPMAPLSWASM